MQRAMAELHALAVAALANVAWRANSEYAIVAEGHRSSMKRWGRFLRQIEPWRRYRTSRTGGAR
jgi:hypothetical protein